MFDILVCINIVSFSITKPVLLPIVHVIGYRLVHFDLGSTRVDNL
jgi:hypothetical protein